MTVQPFSQPARGVFFAARAAWHGARLGLGALVRGFHIPGRWGRRKESVAVAPQRKATPRVVAFRLFPFRATGETIALGAAVLLACTTGFSGGLIPTNATVVLLSGLPGDLESETSYAQQLQDWLELVRPARPARMFVLSDNPAAVNAGKELNAQSLKASRAQFLELAHQLAGGTNPLVVIAWGHAGRQGSTPVFHVRGPRLTPADFKTLADTSPTVQSRWVLMFRGSGAFARQLAGPNRLILSSDNQEAFSSDPMSAKLLLQTARAHPELGFAELAHALGISVSTWYTQRNLARTEEPTLWRDSDQPALLAATTHSVSDDDSAAPSPTGPVSGKKPTSKAVPSPAVPGELTDAWNDIKAVNPGDYPDEDGVILRQRLTCTLGSSPAVSTEQEEFIQVLTPEGKRFGDFDLPFNAPDEELQILDCEVLEPGGKLLRTDPEDAEESSEPATGEYQEPHRKFFSLPGVRPGAILHIRYRSQWQRFPLPQITLELPIADELPVRDCRIQVSVPRAAALHFGFKQLTAPDPTVAQSAYGTSYRWQLKDIPAHPDEVLTPPHQKPRLLLSTFGDWAAFAQWYDRVSRLTAELTPELIAQAKLLTRGATNDRQKVTALYNYVSGLRYVAIPLGVNSYRPHAAAGVLASGFGDCKDKANLLNALLHAENIPANLVLVPRFSQADESLPGLAFNHAISRVNLDGKIVWADTTDEICRFGLLPPGDAGRNVLVLDNHSTNLTQLPAPDPNDHQLWIAGQFTCRAPDQDWPVQLRATARGYPDYLLRQIERGLRASDRPLLAAKFRPVAGSFALTAQAATPASALERDFAWQADGTQVGLAARSDGRELVHSPFWVPTEWDLALHHRHDPLFLNEGYPLILDENFELTLPAGAGEVDLPAAATNGSAPLRWRVEWSSAAGKISARLHAELPRGELTAADTPKFQRQARALLSALAADAVFTPRPDAAKGDELNPESEIRNPKPIQNSNQQSAKQGEGDQFSALRVRRHSP